jgi:asparagine synthase (glutamine-hydrolysing)
MCGVFAMLFRRPLNDQDVDLARKATNLLAHRGPDGDGEWLDRERGVYLGHRRLAIIDPTSASAQPMASAGTVLCYNGEIYNYIELRDRLVGLGHTFSTRGDVEVLIKAWHQWGPEALDHLDGMFAFVLYDGASAYLAVDPFGEKPLFYAQTEGGIAVCSEIKPLQECFALAASLTPPKLAALLALGWIPDPETSVEGTKKVRCGSIIRIEQGRIQEDKRYWVPPIADPGHGNPTPLREVDLDRINTVICESVERRMRTDVPFCHFLSGGIDSSLIAAIAKKEFGKDVQCVTVSFAGTSANDEAAAARSIADELGLEHQVIDSSAHLDHINAKALVDLFGQPSDLLTLFFIADMARAVSDRFRVALAGSGGDEIFFGYGKHAFFYRRRFFYNAPYFLRRAAGVMAYPFRGRSGAAAVLSGSVGTKDHERYIAQMNLGAIGWLRRVDGFRDMAQRLWPESTGAIELDIPKFDLRLAQPSARLAAMDIGSMRHSVEIRSPLLSRRIIETVAGFDPRAFVAFGQKSVLRRLAGRYLSAETINRPKQGFVFPPGELVGAMGTRPPVVEGVSAKMVDAAWAKRAEPGFVKIAARLAVAEAYAAT